MRPPPQPRLSRYQAHPIRYCDARGCDNAGAWQVMDLTIAKAASSNIYCRRHATAQAAKLERHYGQQ